MKGRLRALFGFYTAHLALLLWTLILVSYFLGIGQPGRALITVLAADEISGSAVVGHVQADPLGTTLALFDLEVRTADGKPVASVDAVEVTAASLIEQDFSRVSLRSPRLTVVMDEEGRFNLEGLFPDKPDTGPKEPSLLRIDAIRVEGAGVSLTTPDLALEVGPATVWGSVDQPAGALPGGHLEGRIGQLQLSPLSLAMEDLLAGLLGPQSPAVAGPIDFDVNWGDGNVDIRSVQMNWGPVELYLQGRVDYEQLAGTISLMATREGRQLGALLVRREGVDWAFSLQVSEAQLPGRRGGTLTVPAVELSGLALSALPGQASWKLNRLSIPHLDLGEAQLAEVSLSGSGQYESALPLHEMFSRVVAGTATIADLATNWRQGDAGLSLLIESVGKGERKLVAPLRLRVEAKRTADAKMRWTVDLSLHPHGTVRAELTADLRSRDGRVPYVAQLHVDGLETGALLELMAVPGMLRPMLAGRLDGSLEVASGDLASTVVKVPYCRFDLARAEGGDMIFRTPDDQQDWDFGVAPSFSFFSKEVKFGEGRLLMQVQPQG